MLDRICELEDLVDELKQKVEILELEKADLISVITRHAFETGHAS